MGSICNKISFYFKENLNMEEEDREVIEYALFIIIGSLAEFISIFFIAYVFGILRYTIFLISSFIIFRIFSGGVHCRTYKNCFIVSLGIIISFSGFIKVIKGLITYNIFILLYIIINIYSVYCIYKYIPRDTPNRPITNYSEKIKFKKYTVFTLLLFNIFILYLIKYKVDYAYILSGLMGLFLQMTSTTFVGGSFIKKIDSIIK